MLISQREPRIEAYTRLADGAFHVSVHGRGAQVAVERIGVSLSVDALYEGALELPGDDAA